MAFGCGFSIPAFYGAASGLGMFASASLYLDFTSGNQTLDSRITFTRASAATRTNRAGLIETVSTDQPRFDYDPVTLQPKGLLIEEQRTNLLTYSEQFDNAAWGKNAATVTANATTAPDGTLTADKVEETAVTNFFAVTTNPAGSFSTTYTWSCYAKAAERNFLAINFSVANVAGTFNLTTGEAKLNLGSGTLSAASVGNGWWRCTATITTPASGSNILYHVFGPSSTNGNGTYAGVSGSGIYIWGAQLEAGSFPTSYIPTTSAQATRAADVASITGANFSSFYNQSEGTFVVKSDTSVPVGGSNFILLAQISGGSSRHQMGTYTATTATVDGGVLQSNIGSNTSSDANSAYSYKTNDFAAVTNGGSVATRTSGTVPTNLTYLAIGKADFGGAQSLNGHIKRIAYFPKRLSNTELQGITA